MELIDKNDLIKRMSIGAPMNWTDTDFELGEESQYKSDMEVVESCAEIKVIPIPLRATNGNMFMATLSKNIVRMSNYDRFTKNIRID